MWIVDHAAQETVWTDEILYPTDLAYDDFEDEYPWSSEWDENEWRQALEDGLREGYLVGVGA